MAPCERQPPRQRVAAKKASESRRATHSISWATRTWTGQDTVVKKPATLDFAPNELHMFLALLELVYDPSVVRTSWALCTVQVIKRTPCSIRWAGRGICQAPLKFEPLLARGEWSI